MNKQQLIKELEREGFSSKILKAFRKVKREDFIPRHLKSYAYYNEPLPIGRGSTISQPYTIAFMLGLMELDGLTDNFIKDKQEDMSKREMNKNKTYNIIKDKKERSESEQEKSKSVSLSKITKNNIKILEIGSGSGYVLALINEIVDNAKIYGIEINNNLVNKSKEILKNNKNIHIFQGDGNKGLKQKAPFDRILVSASADKIPTHLFNQLKQNGVLVTPIQNSIFQIKKTSNQILKKEFPGFVFVPLQ